jgi:membrane-associated phospholipid phosphatase
VNATPSDTDSALVDAPRTAPASRATLAGIYARVGLLLPLSCLALAGGALLHHAYAELPGPYTWLQPFRTLLAVAKLPNLPLAAAIAFAFGALARAAPGGFWRERAALRARLEQRSERLQLLLRLLAAVAVIGLDVMLVPTHTPLDTLALGVFAAVLARPYRRSEVRRLLVHTACTALVFTAVCYWFTVVKALTFVGSFTQRDSAIVAFEHALTGVDPYRVVAEWASEHPRWLEWFDWAYTRLFHHMALATAFLFGLRNVKERSEYLGALAICYLVGGPLYWLFPAAGPAYFSPNTFAFLRFNEALNVNWMQSVLYQNTGAVDHGQADVLQTWSYIACMPSLHLAHETVMLYYARGSRWFFALSLAFTLLTAVAVVALGWHYPTDILAGVALAVGAILLCRSQSARLLPRSATE